MLVNYVRDSKRQPVGVGVAIGKYKVGWSLCDRKDKWNKEIGVALAAGRAALPKNLVPAQTVFEAVTRMKRRAVEFYK